jgi:hypothetical protein
VPVKNPFRAINLVARYVAAPMRGHGNCPQGQRRLGIAELEELPQGLYGSARASALAAVDRRHNHNALIVADLSNDATYAEVLLETFGTRVIGLQISRSGDGLNIERRPVGTSVMFVYTKSALSLSEPRRYRDRAHLRFVSAQPCLICGRRPTDAHHLRFAQPRALGRRVSDEFAVPLCRSHHRALHRHGDEVAWWDGNKVDPVVVARELWQRTRLDGPDGGRAETFRSVGVVESMERREKQTSSTAAPVKPPSPQDSRVKESAANDPFLRN